jgi:hypothetical protein
LLGKKSNGVWRAFLFWVLANYPNNNTHKDRDYMRIIIGICIGVGLVSFYPQIGNEIANLFISSGLRDFLVDILLKTTQKA